MNIVKSTLVLASLTAAVVATFGIYINFLEAETPERTYARDIGKTLHTRLPAGTLVEFKDGQVALRAGAKLSYGDKLILFSDGRTTRFNGRDLDKMQLIGRFIEPGHSDYAAARDKFLPVTR